MAEENTNPNVPSTDPTAGQPERTFTQAEVDAIIQTRLERERKNLPSKDELSAFRNWKASQQTEEERMQSIIKERDTNAAALKEANAKAEQYERERLLLSKGVSLEDVDYYAFKIGKLVTETQDFAKSVELYFKDNAQQRARVDITGGMNGKSAEKTTNQSMNDLIRGVRNR